MGRRAWPEYFGGSIRLQHEFIELSVSFRQIGVVALVRGSVLVYNFSHRTHLLGRFGLLGHFVVK